MMRHARFLMFVSALFLSTVCIISGAIAGQSEFILKDGTTIYGEVISFSNGTYKVKTGSLGTIDIKESQIRIVQMRPDGVKPAKNVPSAAENIPDINIDSPAVQSQVKKLQEAMVNDEEIMSLITSLQNDPDFQKILSDPDMLNAISSGDIATLISNPDVLKIFSNATVQEIQRRVGANP